MISRRFAAVAIGACGLLAACGEQKADSAQPAQAAAATTAPQATRDWTTLVQETPEGGFRIGNPNAEVKFLEFASLTCPHCRDFHEASHDALLKNYVASGRVSYEFRPFVLNGPDLAMSVLARCEGAATFFPLLDQVFGTQQQWIEPYMSPSPDEQKRLQSLPPERQVLGIADQGKLADFYKLRGMPRARYEACLTDKANVDKLQTIRNEGIERYKVTGTPTFVLNGETMTGVRNWPEVEAAIKARLR